MLLCQKGAGPALGSHADRVLCGDSLFATSPGQSHVGQARYMGLEFCRLLSTMELFIWTSVPLRMRQGEFRVREGERRGTTEGLLRMDLEKCSVAPTGQERCHSERGGGSRSRSQLEEDGKMELEATENMGAEEETEEQGKEKWGRGRRQTPPLFLEPEVSQSWIYT